MLDVFRIKTLAEKPWCEDSIGKMIKFIGPWNDFLISFHFSTQKQHVKMFEHKYTVFI